MSDMYRHRLLSHRLKQLYAAFPVVVVSGARQVGKTTLLRHHFPNLDYVVFDASLDREDARREPELFLKNHPPPVILDEIQYAPEVVAAIKRAVDRSGARPGQFLLTGSQQWQVMKSLAESLAGRAAFLDLFGFSLQEISNTQDCWLQRWLDTPREFLTWGKQAPRYPGALQEWLWRGSLPRATDIDINLIPDFWNGYHRTYVERDARLAGGVGDWQEFGRFVQLMSALTAQEINYSQLGREIGVTPQTARRWLNIMTDTFQWFALAAFSANQTKRVSARPKGYLADTGLACYHAQISSPMALGGHPLYGALFETAVACELLKQASTFYTRPAFYHWRAAGGAEVDLILERDGVLYPVEIKLTANPNRRHGSGIDAFRKAYPQRNIALGAVICAVEEPRWLSDNIVAIPWNLL
ncbi:MAG: ATP-binding protein [Pseudomonadota bacterium]